MLPTHTAASKKNGISFSINPRVLMSLGWLVVSLLIALFGIWHCRVNAYHCELLCDNISCSLTSTLKDHSATFYRSDIARIDVVKIGGNGQLFLVEETKGRKRGFTNLTLKFEIKIPAEEGSRLKVEKPIQLSPHDMGRRNARISYNNAQKYLKQETNELKIAVSKSITTTGVLSITLGLISLIFACAFGQYSDKTPKRLKKAA